MPLRFCGLLLVFPLNGCVAMLGGLEIDLRGYSVPVNYIYRIFPFLSVTSNGFY